MALNKTIDLNLGANSTYWRIYWVNVNLETTKLAFALKGYIDKPAWQGGKLDIGQRHFVMDIPGGAGTMTWNALVQAMQDYVKTQPEFSGATDNT